MLCSVPSSCQVNMVKALDFLLDAPSTSTRSSSLIRQPSNSTPRSSRFHQDNDEEDHQASVEISSSLLNSVINKSNKTRTTDPHGTKRKGKAGGSAPVADAEDGDAAFIADAQIKQNVKAGTDVAKRAASKVKGSSATSLRLGGGKLTGGGSFQSMGECCELVELESKLTDESVSAGLHPSLLRSLLVRGYTTPTPIQRQAIPSILAQPPRDLVGMARTGSGKTLAYLIPLLHRLNGRHSSTFGVKAIVLCPSRELALQILRVGKELARGWRVNKSGSIGGGGEEVHAQQQTQTTDPIRWGLVVGGESLDEHFALLASNPDVLIATPGRLMHLTVEMNLDLSSVNYVVFDEADRLFEMGFAEQLEELLLRLPSTRQTLLFSATLPKTLVEFARAGLQANPKLVRLDADSKISSELQMAFFSVKPAEKEAALLVLLRDVIGVPFGEQAAPMDESAYDEDDEYRGRRSSGAGGSIYGQDRGKSSDGKKRKRDANDALGGAAQLKPWQTILFCATKHHVEYLLRLLTTCGYACSHIYSSLDQTARTIQMARFRRGQTSLLIVTDVAARGIDLPVLEHVVNYDFAAQPRIFVHRVGRTARAGRKGWAWNLVTNTELPFLCDLQLFLAKPIVASRGADGSNSSIPKLDMHQNLVLGTFPRDVIDTELDFLAHSLTSGSADAASAIPMLKQVSVRAQGMYERSRVKASQQSHRRAKAMVQAASATSAAKDSDTVLLAGTAAEEMGVHDILIRPREYGLQPLVPKIPVPSNKRIWGTPKTTPAEYEAAQAAAAAAERKTKRAAPTAEDHAARAAMLAKINGFTPPETIFEAGRQGANPLAQLMKARRETLKERQKRVLPTPSAAATNVAVEEDASMDESAGAAEVELDADVGLDDADEDDLKAVFDLGRSGNGGTVTEEPAEEARSTFAKPAAKGSFRDANFYMAYDQAGAESERGYSFGGGAISANFAQAARAATFDLGGDEKKLGTQTQRPNTQRWDTKKKKFIKGDGVGSDNKRMIRTESGLRLPASFRSGRFDEWKREKRIDMPKVGQQEAELPAGLATNPNMRDGRRLYQHNRTDDAKRVDRLSDKWSKHSKANTQNEKVKRQESALAAKNVKPSAAGKGTKGRSTGGKKPSGKRVSGSGARNELKSAKDIQKQRAVKEQRRAKNARAPSKGKGKKGGR